MQLLEAAGFSREKAESLTWDTNCMLVNSLGELETRKCLTRRIDEVEAKLTAEMGAHFKQVKMRSTRMFWLLGVALVVALPALQLILGWLGF